MNAQELRALFDYDPLTGIFTNKTQRGNCVKIGAVAGHVNKEVIYLGVFDTAQEAHEAYLAAKREMHKGCTI